MRPNWFIAFPLDGCFVLDLPALPSGFRRFHPEDVHLTLTFLGGCGEAGAARALEALDRALARSPQRPIPVSLARVVPMGPHRAYSALSALLAEGREEVEAFIGAHRDALSDAAHGRREQRAPKAHVTVARPERRASDAQRRAGLEWASALDLAYVQQSLERIALYTWHAQRSERLFRIVAERRLG